MATDKQNKNWERLEAVIHWADMSTNYFARHIGLPRGENLYQIRKGNNGISKDVARRVVERFPEINEMWLLTGSGEMFVPTELRGTQIPLYRVDVERSVGQAMQLSPDEHLLLPIIGDCDMAMFYLSEAMRPRIPSGSVVFLKQIDPNDIIPGKDYVVISGNTALLRTIRTTEESSEWRLEPCDKEHFDCWTVNRASITSAWLVCAHLILNK